MVEEKIIAMLTFGGFLEKTEVELMYASGLGEEWPPRKKENA